METIMNALAPAVLSVIVTIVGAVLSYMGMKIKTYYQLKCDTLEKQNAVATIVRSVEQLYKDLHGEEKLTKAMDGVTEILKSKGVSVDMNELRHLIEAEVYEKNNANM